MALKQDPFEAYLTAIGDNIRRIRRNRGYTLEEVGQDIGLDKSNLHHIEQAKNITVLTLLKIAAILEVTPSELLNNELSISAEDAERYVRGKKG